MEFLDRLNAIVGPKGIIVDPHEMEPYLTDWRGRKQGDAVAIVLPATTEEVSAVVKLASSEGQPVFPLGGNTGLCFGAVPFSPYSGKPGIVLSLRRMNRIRNVDAAGNIITVDAGVVLADVQQAAAAAGRQFPLRLGSEGSAQIGGLVSTNAGGTAAVKYGPMRDLVAGLEVVLADGRILKDLTALRKDNTGYLIRELFIGAEGTLGIITAAALKMVPLTLSSAHAWVAVASPAAAVDLFQRLQERVGGAIEAYELVQAPQFEYVAKHVENIRIPFDTIPAWSLLIELSSSDRDIELAVALEDLLTQGAEDGLVVDAVIANSDRQAAEIWKVRHSVSEANKKAGIGIIFDVDVRTRDVPAFIEIADQVAAERFPMGRAFCVCHLGDGNVHYTLMFEKDFWRSLPDSDAFSLELEIAIHDVAAAFSGSFSAEHGIGRKLIDEMERLSDPIRLELMHGIKTLLDPQWILNPGTLLRPGEGMR